MYLQAFLLTGGASTRMGSDKSAIEIEGEPLGARIGRLLTDAGFAVTILGREPIPGFRFQMDRDEYAGPLAALSHVECTGAAAFVTSCDIPLFDPGFATYAVSEINHWDAAIPVINGVGQPLCAAYSAIALESARKVFEAGERRILPWTEQIHARFLSDEDLDHHGFDPRCVLSANTPEELQALVESK